jgi:TetR/AcrR family tetracycline transcriptional repressor
MADLDLERIAAAALAVADERGAEGFTMRAVADALGVSPMALYHHVEDKAALAALVVEAALNERELPAPTGQSWQDGLYEMALWTRDLWLTHPGVTRIRSEHHVWWTPTMFAVADRWVNLWQQSGLDLDDALAAATMSSLAISGAVDAETAVAATDLPDPPALKWTPAARALFTRKRDPAADFELLVRSVIDGLFARLSLQARERSGSVKRATASARRRA